MILDRSTEGKSARDSITSSSGDGSREPASDIVYGVVVVVVVGVVWRNLGVELWGGGDALSRRAEP